MPRVLRGKGGLDIIEEREREQVRVHRIVRLPKRKAAFRDFAAQSTLR